MIKAKVLVLAIENYERLKNFNDLLFTMPLAIQREVLKYQRWQDRQATLLGKWLLIKGLEIYNEQPTAIRFLQKDAYKRPFLRELKTKTDFNISHSDGMVVCAISQQCKVGIDIEAIQPIILNEYESVFTALELKTIRESNQRRTTFFKYWTRKEAIMKADGRGFYLPPASFEAIKEKVIIKGKTWYIQAINMRTSLKSNDSQYSCHIATDKEAVVEFYLRKVE